MIDHFLFDRKEARLGLTTFLERRLIIAPERVHLLFQELRAGQYFEVTWMTSVYGRVGVYEERERFGHVETYGQFTKKLIEAKRERA